MSTEAPKKDIKTDRFYVVAGACAFVKSNHVQMVDMAPAVIHLVPAGNPDLAAHPNRWPYEDEVRVMHELAVGTVDEHVEAYRLGLNRVYAALARADEPDASIPQLGTNHFGPQHETLAKHGIRSEDGRRALFTAGRSACQPREDQRTRLTGVPVRHDALTRSAASSPNGRRTPPSARSSASTW